MRPIGSHIMAALRTLMLPIIIASSRVAQSVYLKSAVSDRGFNRLDGMRTESARRHVAPMTCRVLMDARSRSTISRASSAAVQRPHIPGFPGAGSSTAMQGSSTIVAAQPLSLPLPRTLIFAHRYDKMRERPVPRVWTPNRSSPPRSRPSHWLSDRFVSLPYVPGSYTPARPLPQYGVKSVEYARYCLVQHRIVWQQ